MTIEELEAEVYRLRAKLLAREREDADVERRTVAAQERHNRLMEDLRGIEEDVRALQKSMRWLVAKARGEEGTAP